MEILRNILLERNNKLTLVKEFQNYIWNTEELQCDEPTSEILRTLAYDLDFCYDDNNRIDKEIEEALEKIKQ